MARQKLATLSTALSVVRSTKKICYPFNSPLLSICLSVPLFLFLSLYLDVLMIVAVDNDDDDDQNNGDDDRPTSTLRIVNLLLDDWLFYKIAFTPFAKN